MKRIISLALCSALICSTALFSGCGEENPKPSETSATEQAVEETTIVNEQELSSLNDLHKINYEGDKFAGAWTISEGEGSQLESFVYLFDGNGEFAYLMVGTMGYITKYELKTDNSSGTEKELFNTKTLFGLNGDYTYEFSEDGMTATLTSEETGKTSTIQKIISYDYIPFPKSGAKIDKELCGAWTDDKDEYLCFDENGIMYATQKGLSFTFYNYSAENGKIDAIYTMKEEISESYDYSIEDDKLNFDGSVYKRIPMSELV